MCCDLNVGDPIVIVRRVLEFAGKPVVVDEIYLPGEIFRRSDARNDEGIAGIALHPVRGTFGVRMVRAVERLRAVAADRASAELLHVTEGSPLLSVERISYTYGDKPGGMAARPVFDTGPLLPE